MFYVYIYVIRLSIHHIDVVKIKYLFIDFSEETLVPSLSHTSTFFLTFYDSIPSLNHRLYNDSTSKFLVSISVEAVIQKHI